MSRIFVRNLPANTTQTDLIEHFQSVGPITDVFRSRFIFGFVLAKMNECLRLLNEKDTGRFRRLAIVGFVDEQCAEKAIAGFDKSYLGSCKIKVEQFIVDKEQRPKPLSRRNLRADDEEDVNSSKHRKMVEDLLGDVRDDVGFKKFVRDFKTIKGERMDESILSQNEKKAVRRKRIFPVKLFGLPYSARKSEVKHIFKSVASIVKVIMTKAKSNSGVAIVWFKNEVDAKKACETINGTLYGAEKRRLELKRLPSKEVDLGMVTLKTVEKKSEPEESECQLVKEKCVEDKLIIKNLWYGCTEDQLRDFMIGKLGEEEAEMISSIDLPRSKRTDAIRGHAIVHFSSSREADVADRAINNQIFQGRLLKVEKVKASQLPVPEPIENHTGLFIKTDTIAAEIASGFGLDKEAVHESKDALARLAIAEAKLVEQQKTKGGDKKFEEPTNCKPSNKLSIKNVPFQVTPADLNSLFRVFGELVSEPRLPKKPTGGHRGFGFVEFVSIDDAKQAYQKMREGTHLFGRRLNIEYAK